MPHLATRGVGGIMVSIAAFQAVDPGSIPGRRKLFTDTFFCLLYGKSSGRLILPKFEQAVIAQLGER